MLNRIFRVSLILLALTAPGAAATLDIVITDASGKPVPNAVVSFTPDAGSISSRVASEARIDQRGEAFVPLVVVVRKGGNVVFTNSDPTMHQVYSFSATKQFQLEVDKGQTSKPVIFDKAGVAAVGCNIHDKMIAHVVVTEAPLAVVTDAKGQAQIRDVPEGAYHATVWHKQLPTGRPLASIEANVSGDSAKFSSSLPVKVTSPNAATHMHMDY
jgi:plastocyanin